MKLFAVGVPTAGLWSKSASTRKRGKRGSEYREMLQPLQHAKSKGPPGSVLAFTGIKLNLCVPAGS